MTEEQKCIADLFKCIDDITEKAKRRDLSLFRISGIGGCDMYQGMPPICRIRDNILDKYEDIIYQSLKEKDESIHFACSDEKHIKRVSDICWISCDERLPLVDGYDGKLESDFVLVKKRNVNEPAVRRWREVDNSWDEWKPI